QPVTARPRCVFHLIHDAPHQVQPEPTRLHLVDGASHRRYIHTGRVVRFAVVGQVDAKTGAVSLDERLNLAGGVATIRVVDDVGQRLVDRQTALEDGLLAHPRFAG